MEDMEKERLETIPYKSILQSRDEVTELLSIHLDAWNDLKRSQTSQERNFRHAEMFNIIEICLRDSDIKLLISLLNWRYGDSPAG